MDSVSIRTFSRSYSNNCLIESSMSYGISARVIVMYFLTLGLAIPFEQIYRSFNSEKKMEEVSACTKEIFQQLVDDERSGKAESVLSDGRKLTIEIFENGVELHLDEEGEFIEGLTRDKFLARMACDMLNHRDLWQLNASDYKSISRLDISNEACEGGGADNLARFLRKKRKYANSENFAGFFDGVQRCALGGGLSFTYFVEYGDGKAGYFKPISSELNGMGDAAFISGIARLNSKPENRSVFSYNLSRRLEFDVIPETKFIHLNGVFGYVQDVARGHSAYELQSRSHVTKQIFGNSDLVKSFVNLQLLDALSGQADRHSGNYFVDVIANTVRGIDNDQCAGRYVTHPHYLLFSHYGPDELDARLVRSLDTRVPVSDRAEVMSEVRSLAGQAVRGVWLPPVMDNDQISKIRGLTDDDLAKCMRQSGLTDGLELAAAISRLEALKAHIAILEKRQGIIETAVQERCEGTEKIKFEPVRSVIDPSQWSEAETQERLIPSPRFVSSNLTLHTTYLSRDFNRPQNFG